MLNERSDQRALWDVYQTEHLGSFADSAARLRHLLSLIGAPCTVLNIGIGGGIFETMARQRGHRVMCLDPGVRTASAAKTRMPAGIQVGVAIGEYLPLRDRSVDVVVASEVLEHLTDSSLEHMVREVRRVLIVGGRFIGTVPFDEDLGASHVVCPKCTHEFHRWGHQQAFDVDRVTRLLGDFDVDRAHCIRFVPWKRRNLRGKVIEGVRKALHRFGIHGPNENILFGARRPRT